MRLVNIGDKRTLQMYLSLKLMPLTPLIENGRFTSKFWLLFAGGILSLSLFLVRVWLTGGTHYMFLTWNLFLAAIPLILSSVLLKFKQLQRWYLALPMLVTWLLFLPNAPYILTDLFHLRQRGVPLWFDLVMLLSFAWNGLLYGLVSLQQVQGFIEKKSNRYVAMAMSSLALFASAFGIYLGRYLRWNSWDILRSPDVLAKDIFNLLLHPEHNPQGVGMTLAYGCFLVFVYVSLHVIANDKSQVMAKRW